MKAMRWYSLLVLLCCVAGAPAFAQEGEQVEAAEEEFADAPLPPDLPDPLESGKAIEPEVLIIKTDKAVIEEYRLNGKHYMSKITPAVGPPYFLLDRDGDGQMEARMSEVYEDFTVPQWVIFSW
ncbi:MAG: DUF2782 domain-containing protein [Gammaproteobacteria bacterium]